jgi:hypothetical protein
MRAGAALVGAARVAGAALVAWLANATIVLAATPSPSSAAGGDPRSSGQGPGLVGDPALALLAVLLIGVGAVLVTLVYVRLTARRDG